MKTLININAVTDPVIEEHIFTLRNEVENYCTVQAATDAAKHPAITRAYFKIQIHDFVLAAVQNTINAIKARLLNLAGIVNAAEAQRLADAENAAIENHINDLKHEQARLKTRRDVLKVNHWKRKYARWFIFVALGIGILDGSILFANVASGGYGLAVSFLAAIVVTILIAFSHKITGPWIERASTQNQKLLRTLCAFGSIFIICVAFGTIRAGAANNMIDVAVSSSEIAADSKMNVSGWVIAMVSFSACLLTFFLSKFFMKTADEVKAEEEYVRLTTELQAISKQIQELSKEKKANAAVPVQMKQEERVKFNVWQTSLAQCKGIATGGIVTYRQIYSRNNPVIPDFFNDPIEFHFDEKIDFSPTSNQ